MRCGLAIPRLRLVSLFARSWQARSRPDLNDIGVRRRLLLCQTNAFLIFVVPRCLAMPPMTPNRETRMIEDEHKARALP